MCALARVYMENRRYIPIKYKFLAVLFSITLLSLGVFFAFTYKTFSEDKKLFVMDLNISVLRATTSDIKLELKSRIEELQILVPRVYQQRLPKTTDKESEDLFQGLSASLSEELLRVSFYRRTQDNTFELFREYENKNLIEKRHLPADFQKLIEEKRPLKLIEQADSPDMGLLNRSVAFASEGRHVDLPIITFLVNGNYVDSEAKGVVIAIDLMQDFLRKTLQQSEIAEIFLIKKDGSILSHSSSKPTVEFASRPFPHPIVPRIGGRQFPRESMELSVKGEAYLCNISETGFKDIFAVSQIKRSEAFLALQTLIRKSIYLSIFVLALALVLSILFARGLTSNIQKLQQGAELIGAGNLKVKLNVKSRDEIGLVSESFQWMAGRIQELLTETAEKVRMEEELETARLVQSTLLTTPTFNNDAFQIESFYTAASECGGDFWDAFVKGNTLTLIVGDATGHGTPAAMVTAVAKSCFATINAIFRTDFLPPEQLLEMANHVTYTACQGKLLMTMCLIQLDLETGKLVFCSAGHEPVFCLRKKPAGQPPSLDQSLAKKSKIATEVLFARGERLGFAKDTRYTPEVFQMNLGDTLMLYTDGLSEARNPDKKEWGERALKKAFTKLGDGNLSAVKSHILQTMTDHVRNEPYHDDVTFVLLRWLKGNIQTRSQNSEIEEAQADLLIDTSDGEAA